MRELTISAIMVRALTEFAVSTGASRARLLERSRIHPAELSSRDHRVPFGKYVALMRAGQELCRDPALALHFGETVDVSEISMAGAVGAVHTVDDALSQLNRYSRIDVEVEGLGSRDRFSLTRNDSQAWIVDNRGNPNAFPELTESTFARMVCSTRRSFGDRRLFGAVHVTHAAPPYRSEYERIFGVPVVFESDRNGLQIDEAMWSSFRFARQSPYATAVLREHAEALLQRLETSQSIRGRVESLLVPLLPSRGVGVTVIARHLGMSRQTLFRKLKAEDVTFEQVLDELRHKTALRLLHDERTSVKQAAALVGFADPAAFSRAFKRWTGSSPLAYRRVPNR